MAMASIAAHLFLAGMAKGNSSVSNTSQRARVEWLFIAETLKRPIHGPTPPSPSPPASAGHAASPQGVLSGGWRLCSVLNKLFDLAHRCLNRPGGRCGGQTTNSCSPDRYRWCSSQLALLGVLSFH